MRRCRESDTPLFTKTWQPGTTARTDSAFALSCVVRLLRQRQCKVGTELLAGNRDGGGSWPTSLIVVQSRGQAPLAQSHVAVPIAFVADWGWDRPPPSSLLWFVDETRRPTNRISTVRAA